jgi:DNA-binding NarL/FixJ family response regulator
MKLIIVDRRIAFFPIDPRNHERGYLEVSQEPVVESLTAAFEQEWADAEEPHEPDEPDLDLTERDRTVIDLLALGHTDAAVAAHLRLSERTITTIVKSLMDRVGATNRFQLGIALGALRAALPPPRPTPTD